MKMLLAGVLAGCVVFVWSAVDHMVLPLGALGIKTIPNEDLIMNSVRAAVREPGLYLFPGMSLSPEQSKEEKDGAQKAFEQRYRQGPTGILVVRSTGAASLSGAQLGAELVTNLLAAVVAGILLSMAAIGSFGGRLAFCALLGLFASLSVDLSLWIWYGFPGNYTMAALADQVMSWSFGGLVLAAMVKPRR